MNPYLDIKNENIIEILSEVQRKAKELIGEHLVNRVIKGLDKIEISIDDFKSSLIKGAGPCTLQELEESFKNFIQEKVKGKEKERGRIVIF